MSDNPYQPPQNSHEPVVAAPPAQPKPLAHLWAVIQASIATAIAVWMSMMVVSLFASAFLFSGNQRAVVPLLLLPIACALVCGIGDACVLSVSDDWEVRARRHFRNATWVILPILALIALAAIVFFS